MLVRKGRKWQRNDSQQSYHMHPVSHVASAQPCFLTSPGSLPQVSTQHPTIPVYSLTLESASSYFYLPIEDDEDLDLDLDKTQKHIAWESSSTLDYEVSDISPTSSSSSVSSTASIPPDPPRRPTRHARSRSVIKEVLTHDDLYKILGISRSSQIDRLSLRRAYLTRSKACHPE